MKRTILLTLIAVAGCGATKDEGGDVTVNFDEGKGDGQTTVDVLKTYNAARNHASMVIAHPVLYTLDGARPTVSAKMEWSWRFINGTHFADIGVSHGSPQVLHVGTKNGGLSTAFDPSEVAIGGSSAVRKGNKTLPGSVVRTQLKRRTDFQIRWVVEDENQDLASIDADTGDVVDGDANGDGVEGDAGDSGDGFGDGGDSGDGGDGGGDGGGGDGGGGGGDGGGGDGGGGGD